MVLVVHSLHKNSRTGCVAISSYPERSSVRFSEQFGTGVCMPVCLSVCPAVVKLRGIVSIDRAYEGKSHYSEPLLHVAYKHYRDPSEKDPFSKVFTSALDSHLYNYSLHWREVTEVSSLIQYCANVPTNAQKDVGGMFNGVRRTDENSQAGLLS